MKTRLTSLVLVITLVFPAAPVMADDLPDLGDASESSLSLQDEARIGREAYQAMQDSGEVLDDVEVNTYLNQIGQRIDNAAHIPQQRFTYFAVNDNAINAFAMPGGYIGINRGLILATQSEGELASVMAHETAHVTQRHMARMRATSSQNQLLVLAAIVATAVAAGSGRGDMAGGALQAGIGLAISNQLSYSRDFEREADRVGMQYLAGSGFDARDMPAFFGRLQSANRFNDNNAYAFLRTHPVTVERISEGQDRAANFPVRMQADSPSYLLVREKLRASTMLPAEAVKYYQASLQNRQFLNEGAQYYGLARAQMLARDWRAASLALSEAEKRLPRHSMLLSTSAEIARLSGDVALARSRYQTALAVYPQDKALIYGELDTLINSGQRVVALSRVKQQQSRYPQDPELYQREARLYSDEDRLRYHAALGNAFYFLGKSGAALEQYQLASTAPGDDFYLRSSIEARMRELRSRLDAERQANRK